MARKRASFPCQNRFLCYYSKAIEKLLFLLASGPIVSARGGQVSVRTSGFSPTRVTTLRVASCLDNVMFYVYILRSTLKNYHYIGSTEDLKKRLQEHNQGKTKSIKHLIPFELRYHEAYLNKTVARKRELELKRNSFKKKRVIVENNRGLIMAPSSIG